MNDSTLMDKYACAYRAINGCLTNINMKAHISALRAVAEVPDGFVLVPLQPTEMMIDAALNSQCALGDKGIVGEICAEWKAMVLASMTTNRPQ